MSEYTPTTTEILASYVIGEHLTNPTFPVKETEACFRNWRKARDQEVTIAALREAREAVEATVIRTEQTMVPVSEYPALAARRDGGIEALRTLDALIESKAVPVEPQRADEWCREESCQHRHWRSGSMPTHKRGRDCPEPQQKEGHTYFDTLRDLDPGGTMTEIIDASEARVAQQKEGN